MIEMGEHVTAKIFVSVALNSHGMLSQTQTSNREDSLDSAAGLDSASACI